MHQQVAAVVGVGLVEGDFHAVRCVDSGTQCTVEYGRETGIGDDSREGCVGRCSQFDRDSVGGTPVSRITRRAATADKEFHRSQRFAVQVGKHFSRVDHLVLLIGIHIISIHWHIVVARRAVGHGGTCARQAGGAHVVQAVAGALHAVAVGLHIEVVGCLGGQGQEGVMLDADGAHPVGSHGGCAVGHGGHTPLRLVGKHGVVALPLNGDGRVGDGRGVQVGHRRHGVVGGEAHAIPRRGAVGTAVVLHVEVVLRGGGQTRQGDRRSRQGRGRRCGALQRLVGDGRGADDIAEVVALGGFGLLPGQGGVVVARAQILARDLVGHVGRSTADAQGAELTLGPGAAAVVMAVAVVADGLHVDVVERVGIQTRKSAGEGCALVGQCAARRRVGQGRLAVVDLVVRGVVARRGLPAHRGALLLDVRGGDTRHLRAGHTALTVLEANLRQETAEGVGIIVVVIARVGAVGAVEIEIVTIGTCCVRHLHQQIAAVVGVGLVEGELQIGSRIDRMTQRAVEDGGKRCIGDDAAQGGVVHRGQFHRDVIVHTPVIAISGTAATDVELH